MKVYFENTGGGGGKSFIRIYVTPDAEGNGYYYNVSGKKCKFKWASPKRARVYNSSDLPKELWYSIKHGTCDAEVDYLKKDIWAVEDLEYNVVLQEEVKAFNKVSKQLPKVKTVEEYKNLYPLIKKGGRINNAIINKLFEVCNMPEIDINKAKNGEIGIAFWEKYLIYYKILEKLNIE